MKEQVPEWAKGAVIYQIFPDRFYNGNPANDVRTGEYIYADLGESRQVSDWNSPAEALDVCRFYGGDLQGIREKLPYLRDLGIEVLYLNPIFLSPSNHGYDIADYETVDPHLSDPTDPNGYFADFMAEVHGLGMRVILDGVFNHCSCYHPWMDVDDVSPEKNGAANHPESPYRSYFSFDEEGKYEAWWDYKTLPKLNYEASEELCESIINVGVKWVSPPYSADGWRLDVGMDLGHSEEFNHRFWERFTAAVKAANPKALVLAEHYEDPSPWLNGREWDTVMNYRAFFEPVSLFFTGMDKHSKAKYPELEGDAAAFRKTMEREMARLPKDALLSAMNQLDNHDHSRFITRTNGRVGTLAESGSKAAGLGVNLPVYREAAAVLLTWPGAATLYYGDETAIPGWTDPDNRRTFPWDHRDWELTDYFRGLISLRKRYPALRRGSLTFLKAEGPVLIYERTLEKEVIVTAVNRSEKAVRAELPELSGAGLKRLALSDISGYTFGEKLISGGEARELELPPESAAVYKLIWEE